MKKVLVIIDPQKDFIISPTFTGSLGVPGAYEDMLRIAEYIKKENPSHIVITMDTHNVFDIANHEWWINSEGKNPTPFTLITVEDVQNGIWKAAKPEFQEHAEFYVKKLAEQNKYKLYIWPNHCIKGTEGHKVNPELLVELNNWEIKNNKKVEYIYKGMNHKTEHYSALKAEVVLDDEDTKLRKDIIEGLQKYDEVIFTGEASSHCTAGTTIDYLENITSEKRKNVIIFKNCMSPVKGFEDGEKAFFEKALTLDAKVIDWKPNNKLKIK